MAEKERGILGFEALPEKLCRYRPGNSEHLGKELKALRHGCVWLSDLERQNDPYEGRPVYELNGFDELHEEYQQLCREIQSIENKDHWLYALNNNPEQGSSKEFFNAVTNAHREFISEAPRNFKLACFSYDSPAVGREKTEKHGEALMWAHYANSFQGFRLEFEKRKVQEDGWGQWAQKFFKVEYVADRPQISALEMLQADFFKASPNIEWFHFMQRVTQSLTAIKSELWKYERELRLVTLGYEPGYYRLPYYYLTGVTFGLRCKPETVWKVWSELGDGISYCHQRLSPDGFGFEYQECNFPPRVCGSEA